MDIAIIGGGAAGFFAAIAVKSNFADANVTIFEKSQTVLAKVKVSGGGRCNVTNGCDSISELCKAYPRGEKWLKAPFHQFSNRDTLDWFRSRGVPLVIQEDNCVFPLSQNSQSIIDCLIKEAKLAKVQIHLGMGVAAINRVDDFLELQFAKPEFLPQRFDKVIVTTGGSPKREGLNWLESLGHAIENPVPSLFTFSLPTDDIRKLMGVVVDPALVAIQGTKISATGALLITHWGMSGPAILKLSSFGARMLNQKAYTFTIKVNWANQSNSETVYDALMGIAKEHPNKSVINFRPFLLPERLWAFLLDKSAISESKKWSELGNKGINKLTNILTNDLYEVGGKSTFKDEFVTCGGVSLQQVDAKTMQSRVCPNLYFAGEVLDIDAITGGYNFQAAWTTAYVAAKLLS